MDLRRDIADIEMEDNNEGESPLSSFYSSCFSPISKKIKQKKEVIKWV
jgi:hypothetical protein